MDTYGILVIILAIALGLSLVVWIFVGVLFIQVLKKVKQATDSAKAAVDHVESFASQLTNIGKFSAISSVVSQITKAFKSKRGDK